MGGPSTALLASKGDPGPTTGIPCLQSLDEASLLFVINHVFLPPALPTKSDRTPEHEASLIRVFKDCAEKFARHFKPQSNSRRAWDVILRMLAATALLHERGIEEARLEKQINGMKVGDVVPVYVAAQNAVIILRRPINDQTIITLESFEVYPPSTVVTRTEGKIRIVYPSVGRLSIPIDRHVRKSLSQFVGFYALNPRPDAQVENSTRTQSTHDPQTTHDSPSPKYITELLTGIVRAMSEKPDAVLAQTVYISKRIDDHILCERNSEAPWRRSRLWLIIRVALQTTLCEWNVEECASFKSFMLYALSSILHTALQLNQPDHLLFVMNAKLARRFSKMPDGSRDGCFAMDGVAAVNKMVANDLEKRWKAIQKQTTRQVNWSVPTKGEVINGARIDLLATVPYLKGVKCRDVSQLPMGTSKTFVVPGGDQYATRHNADLVSPPDLTNLPSAPLESTIRLYDFEQWVARQNGFSKIDMLELTGALNNYTHSALSHYNGDPERLSVAFLTMIELWIGIDEKVIEWEPYLKNYTPEIPSEVLEPLLLPRRDQMQRLSCAEIYLQKRHSAARSQSTIFYDTTDPGSFANWFVNQSQSLQTTLQEIKKEAWRDEEKKLAEMIKLNDRYKDLRRKIGAAVCTVCPVQTRSGLQTEYPYCDRCNNNKHEPLWLTRFERPLPDHPVIDNCIAFELRLPRQFSLWRDATAVVLSACSGGITEPTNGNPLLLSGYTGYKKRFTKAYPDCKLELAAYGNEYNTICRPPISQPDIIEPHSMNQYRVLSGGSWGRNPFFSSREASFQYLHKLLSMEIDPSGPYCSLQPAVSSTTYTSNDVVASQSSCPESITLHDHEAFGHIRTGHRLQWRNMLRELRRGILNISHKDVYLLLLQAMWQAGPRSKGNEWHRESHLDGDEAVFGLEALQELELVLDGIQDNRTWAYGCGVLIAMAARILSLTDKPTVHDTATSLLKRVRHVIHKWLKEITGADGRTDTEIDVADEAGDRAVERTRQTLLLAILGCSTFDVDDEHIDHVFQSAEDVSLLVECRYTICMNTPPALGTLPFSLRILYHRDQVLAIRLLPRLSARIGALPGGESGVDEAIKSIWHGYKPTGRWDRYGHHNQWYSTRTAADHGFKSLEVHFNLLDGALYVDHKMFGKLPDTYTQHLTYRRLFGESRVLEVGPSDMPNMEYQTKKPVCGWQVHFKLDSNDLVVRSHRDDELFELIPESKFTSVLPRSLIYDYFHWYNVKTHIVEFRPLADRWTPSLDKNWSTAFQLNGVPVLSRQQDFGVRQFLVAPNHALSHIIHNLFSPLEPNIFDLLITFRSTNHNIQPLSISLLRFNIAFAVTKRGSLGCLSHRGFILDSDQDIGTLYGLSNKLVLCRPSKFGRDRKVIIPIGSIRHSSTGVNHPNVSIDTAGDARSIRYRVYEVDELLGRLRETTFSDRLYRLYLHALTSHQLVDPLTKRTGTEEALEGLTRASSFSFQALSGEDFDLLQRLGQLTPHRSLSSTGTTIMQIVKRHVTLPPTLEHHDFAGAVQKIWSHWQNIRVFHAESQERTQASDEELLPEYRTAEHQQLTRRAATRNLFYSPSWSDPPKSRTKDSNYTPRDCMREAGSMHRTTLVFEMAKLVQDWPASLDVTAQLLTDVKKWGRVEAYNPELTLDYRIAWVGASLFRVWRSLYSLCRTAKKETDQSKLTFLLGTFAYLHPDEHHLHTTLLAFATCPQFAQLPPPSSGDLDLSHGDAPTESRLRSLVAANTVQFEESVEYRESYGSRGAHQRDNTVRSRYESRRQQQIDECVSMLVQLRYQGQVSPLDLPSPDLIEKWTLLSQLHDTLKHCYRNRLYFEHLQLLQNELNRIKGPAVRRYLFAWAPLSFQISPERYPFVTWSMLLSRPPSRTSTPLDELLESCFDRVGDICVSPLQQQYRPLLEKSKIAHAKRRHITSSVDVEHEYHRTSTMLDGVWGRIIECLGVLCEKDLILARAGLWPRLSPRDILDKLAISQRSLLSESWKAEFIKYAEEVTMVQRVCRISRLTTPEYRTELERELNNSGRIGWDAMSYLDWLLIELESNVLIRQVQAEIAIEMLSPSSGENAVVQLNMGEGKSSVIVPIVSAALANRSQIVRVVVLKPLARQMFHLLCRTLSGLTNRRIFYIPIDRSLRPDAALANRIHNLFVECMEAGGILLCQPEHILSFKLMAFEALSGSPSAPSRALLSTQRWLEENARDILDESDEILSPKYQLIYTMGTQRAPDGRSMRWKLAQEVFNLIRVCARDESYEGSLSVIGSSPQQFPQIRVFTQDCGKSLLCQVVKCIVFENLLPSFSCRHFSAADRTTLFHFITETAIDRALYNQVILICQNKGDSPTLKSVLLLRGLLGHGILLTALKEKRWRVDYGLDVSRSMLAVPYWAKDRPSPRAEFGHTDVAICLTCLSYYYEGLTDPQLGDCFQHLFKTDNPNQGYEEWIKDYHDDLPKTLRSLRGLNLGDPVQCHEHIFPRLRYCKAVIDFFLSTIVFPKYMKEFTYKLSTSGWDLAQDRSSFGKLVTGFSGTNDNRFLLPQMIGQVDLGAHIHTNAMGLDCILRQENSKVIHLPGAAKDIRGMLEHLRDEEAGARVLLDVGAQVLELQNKEVAALWLEVDPRPEIEAAVFVDSKDDLQVLRRDDVVELLVSSPYKEQLGRCVVYLDEAHTRGTDLKLPPGSRAVVTLGPRLCKDKLMQGCMRMRKLGSTHSVCFLVSTEVSGYITAATRVADHQMMSKHVLKWTIQETITQLRTYAPLWAHQGRGFDDRNRAWERYKEGSASAHEFISILKNKESYSLKELYGMSDSIATSNQRSELKIWIQDRCKEFDVGSTHDTKMREEQEREVLQVKEEQWQVNRPPPAVPFSHALHEDVQTLISTGSIPINVKGILSARHCLLETTLVSFTGCLKEAAFPHIFVTEDFARTIETTVGYISNTSHSDDFLRPVQWILSSSKQPELVLLSPFEANALVDEVRESPFVTLHIYAPRTSRNMRSFEDLQSFMVPHRDPAPAIPANIISELNLFAGQLYFASRSAYEGTCQMLGLYLKDPPDSVKLPPGAVDSTGFVRGPSARKVLGMQYAQFTDNPLAFLRKLTELRRKGQGFLPTHVGQMLHSRDIPDDEFD